MNISTAEIQTGSARRYLQQLCKHWAHKFPVQFDAGHGTIALPFGTCTLDADEQALKLRLEAANAGTDQRRFEDVVAEHLQRFAFREPLDIKWN